jgi:hypothetical protein
MINLPETQFVYPQPFGLFNCSAVLTMPVPGEKGRRVVVEFERIDPVCDDGSYACHFPAFDDGVDSHLAFVAYMEKKGVFEMHIDGVLDDYVSRFISEVRSGNIC